MAQQVATRNAAVDTVKRAPEAIFSALAYLQCTTEHSEDTEKKQESRKAFWLFTWRMSCPASSQNRVGCFFVSVRSVYAVI
jgi:hypothetical protein